MLSDTSVNSNSLDYKYQIDWNAFLFISYPDSNLPYIYHTITVLSYTILQSFLSLYFHLSYSILSVNLQSLTHEMFYFFPLPLFPISNYLTCQFRSSCWFLEATTVAREIAHFSARFVGPLSRCRWIEAGRASFRKNLHGSRLSADGVSLASCRFVHGVYTPMVVHAPKIDSERHRQGIDLRAYGWFVVTSRNCAYPRAWTDERSETVEIVNGECVSNNWFSDFNVTLWPGEF